VLLHGLMGEVDNWAATLECLDPFCRAIALSVPVLDAEFALLSPLELAAWVRRFLDHVGIRRAVLGGNSLGGHVALEVALAYPDRVSGLVLTGSSGLFERSFTRGVPHRPDSEWLRARMEEIFFDPTLVTPEWVEAVHRMLSRREVALRLLHVARAAKRRNVEPHLVTIAAPTCIVWGEDDRITPPDVARRFFELIPRAELFLLPRCGHAPMLEQPAAFNAVLAGWLLTTGLAHARSEALVGVAA
jgi:pimeloyl-ACP methyl ester carboxylesterase